MKRARRVLAVITMVGGAAAGACAIDRDADSIDSLFLKGAAYEDTDALGVQAQTEIALATEREAWAILAGIGYVNLSPKNGSGTHEWSITLGIRFYPAELTALSLTGHHTESTRRDGFEANGVTVAVRQRFLSANEVLSPFALLRATLEDAEVRSPPNFRHSFTHLVLTAELGCDFMMRDDLALSLAVGYSESEDLPGSWDSRADGWITSAGLVYYWD